MNRLARLRQVLQEQDLPNFLVTRLSNIRYLCGFSGSAATLLLTPMKNRFFSDFRYQSQAAEQVHDADVFIYKDELAKELRRLKLRINTKIGFEAAFLDVATYHTLKGVFPNAEWIPTSKIVENIASVKDAEEVKKIRKAAKITDAVYEEVIKLIKPGVCEFDISAEITYLQKKKGADGDSFPAIVASGERSTLPHGIASSKKIKKGDIVTIDMGCFYQGYASDLTRNVVVGKANPKVKEIHALVLAANRAAVSQARDGMTAKELDEVARSVIRQGGYADHFGHGLGHGLGLEIHTEPRVHFTSDDILKAGQVFTIEPGIYIPGFGGIRIEDDILLSEQGCEVLTHAPRKLFEV